MWAGQGSSLAAFRKGSAAFLAFSGQQASRRCQVGGRHLPTVSYGPFQTKLPFISEYTIFAHLDRLVSLHFVPGRRSSNSCSAAFLCVSCATRRIRFLLQTFSRNDPPGQAPPTRGRSVLKKGVNMLEQCKSVHCVDLGESFQTLFKRIFSCKISRRYRRERAL